MKIKFSIKIINSKQLAPAFYAVPDFYLCRKEIYFPIILLATFLASFSRWYKMQSWRISVINV